VIVSGTMADGASGVWAVKRCGGLVLVQDPGEAHAEEMPRAAMRAVEPDHVAGVRDLGRTLSDLARTDAPDRGDCPRELRLEVDIAAGGRAGRDRMLELGDPSGLTCPHCHGVLSEVREGKPLRFRCQVGHAITGETLFAHQNDDVEEAMRVALRVMEERSELVTRMASDAGRVGRTAVAEIYAQRAEEYGGYADTLRRALVSLLPVELEEVGSAG
jgi:two-component system chemotaxis response regulator CheB